MTKPKPLRTLAAGRPFEPPLRRTALALLIAACFNAAHANPVLPQVVHGQATFNQQGNLFTITNTPNTIINWQSFSVNPGEITRFLQQNAGSSVLNRITGQDPSKILGSLQSNGKVFLINPNGVLFGRDAKVDVAGLVASSLALSNQDFLAGKMNFNAGDQAGAVINQGSINAGSGGRILLIAPNVENSGIITAPNGDVLLAAGHSVQLADAANPDLRVVLSAPGDQAINIGQVVAQGGRIGMLGALLNQRGVLNANSAVVGENGKIVLKATGKTLLENGSVTSATSAAGKGGEITVLGDQVGMQGNARADASGALGGGTVLLGGDYQGKNPAIVNARQVAVGKDASIAADAIQSGDGGKVIVWGNETARVFGSISARGGAASGNGGLVETSGHYLAVDGIRVDTSSLRGKRGNWLLDPYDIEVVNGYCGFLGFFGCSGFEIPYGYNGGLQNADQFADAPSFGTTYVGAAAISNSGSNVTLQATHRISFNNPISMMYGDVSITATAGERIDVNAPITTMGGAVTLSANDATSGHAAGATGVVNLNAAISTNNGAVALSGASILGAGAVNVGNGSLSLTSNLAGGAIVLTGTGDQLLGSSAEGRTVLLQADNISFSGGLNFGGTNSQSVLTFKPLSNGRQIDLGSKPGTALGLTNDELNRVAASTVNIGDANSGDITISAPVNLVNQQATGGIAALSLETGGTLIASNKLAMLQAGSALNVTAGNVTVASGGGLSADATVSLVADNMSLGGAAQSIAAGTGTGTGAVSLTRRSNNGSIEIGSAGVDGTISLGLTDSELKTISAPTLKIGRREYGGALNLQGALDLGSSTGLNLLELRSGGNINLNGALAVAKNLTMAAFNGEQSSAINASGIVNVGGAFLLDGGNWVQNNASLPAFTANSFRIANGTFLRVKGGNGDAATPYQIADVYGLQGIGMLGNNKNYILAGNIDASGTANWNQGEMGTGFAPLFRGDVFYFAYGGTFDGAGHSISGLTINAGGNPVNDGSGLFARLMGGTIRNLAMVGGSVSGGNNVGAVVGNNLGGTISNVSSSMMVSGNSNVGGLVGANRGVINNASASGNVTGLASGSTSASAVGGLVGSNLGIDDGSEQRGTITVARATGAVNATGSRVGGLIGNNDGDISQAYATGAVGGAANVGGLVGRNGGAIADAYATGTVGLASPVDEIMFRENIGGVIGWSVAGSSASRLYFSGNVSGNGFSSGTVGAVVGRADPGASVGPAFFDAQTAGTEHDQGGSTGRSTAEMQKQSSFGGFNFGEGALWRMYEGHTTPLLKAFLTPLQVSASGAASRVYDGQVAGVGTLSYVGLLNGDLAASGTASYGDARNVGNYALGGLWSTQYDISYAGTTTVAITPRPLSVILGGSKVYDGQLGFANAALSLGNAVSGDTLGVTGTAQFVDKNAGAAKAVNLTDLVLSGNELGNYSLAATGSGTAEISRASLALGTVSVANKLYDGNTSASLSGSLTGVIGGDQVQLSGASASFTDKNVGAAKDVNYSVTGSNLSGSDAGNYVLNTAEGRTSAAITARTLHLGFTGINKTYDGGAAAFLTISDDRIANDVLTATANAAFADKNAGTAKAITVQGASLSGTDAANYTLGNTGGTATADITRRALDLSFAGVNKTYDGGTTAAVTVTDNRVTGDVLSASATAAFGDKNAGSGKTVTVTGASLSGTDAANYTLGNTGGTATADITRRALDLGFAGVNKTYDGGTTAAVTVTDNRVTGDVLSASATAAFGDKNAGTAKAITVQGASLSGTDAANYTLGNTGGTATADITRRALDLSFAGVNKVYDGGTTAAVTVTDNRVTGDVLTATATGAFADKNAALGKMVTVRDASLSGTDAANYTLGNTGGTATADITRRALDLGFAGVNKTYDGGTTAAVTVTDNRVTGDVLSASATGAFGDKNAGTGKTVTVTGASLSGTDAANYKLVKNSGNTEATIDRASLNLSNIRAGNKTYDGNRDASVGATLAGVLGKDEVQLSGVTGSFRDKNAATGKDVDYSAGTLSGADIANYTLLNGTGTLKADITPRTLTVSVSGGKTYDGLTGFGNASLALGNVVEGETLGVTGTAQFTDKNAGTGKEVTVKGISLSGNALGNYSVAGQASGVANITARDLTLSFTGVNKIYDGLTGAAVTIGDNRVAGDVLTATASGAFADKNAGANKAVTVRDASLSGTDAGNYVVANTRGTTSADITQRDLTLGFAGVNKVYDGKAAASLIIGDDRIKDDVLTVSADAAFADKNAGSRKPITVQNVSVTGADAANYKLIKNSGNTEATIDRASLNLSNIRAGNKTYDGNRDASVGATLAGVLGKDEVQLSGVTGSFRDKNAATGKDVDYSAGTLSGADIANYTLLNGTGTLKADITPRTLTVSVSGGKTYDGLTGFANASLALGNVVEGETLGVTGTAQFTDKNAGTGKEVTVKGISLSGNALGNYSVAGQASGVANITARDLTLSFTGVNKIYDGLTGAAVTIGDNRVAGDVLTAAASGAFADKNAGTGKTVTVTGASLSGTDAANYTLGNTGGTATADITRRALDLSFAGVNKTYDGGTTAAVTVTDNRIAGDVLSASATAAFGDKNAGTGKTVTVTGASLSGTDAANYKLIKNSGNTEATIDRASLNLSNIRAGNKTYDGNRDASVGATLAGVLGKDEVQLSGVTGSFRDKNAATGKDVDYSAGTLSGADIANYTLLNGTGTLKADITPRTLTVSVSGGKTYDGLTGFANASLALGNVVEGETLGVTGTAQFTDKNAGTGKEVTVKGISLSGNALGNYSVAGQASGVANITARDLTLSFTGVNKIYDGLTGAAVTIGDNRVAGDVLTATASGAFADKNAGASKAVTVQNASLSGVDAGNYVLNSTTGATSATIIQRALALGFAAAGKTYDGSTAATVAVTDNRIAGDVLTATASGAFADKNAGTNKSVTVQNASLSGVDAANYVLSSTSGATSATITQRELALGFAAAGKTYDGNTAATVAITDNRVAGDVLNTSASAAFADKNAGSGKTVTVQNASLSGTDAGNYRLASSGGTTTATVAQRALTLAYAGVDKVYDGATGAQVAISDNRVAGDVLSASASAAFADKNAGSGKTVTVQGAALSGADAGNYSLANTGGATTANIARAALTLGSVSASDKVYDGTQAASVSGTVAGVIGQDAVSLAGGSGTFADRNFGTGKTVTVGGFQLAGSDAGNYTLASNSGVAQASIAQRALSTWTGANGGLWSDAANWEGGVAPSGSNVLAADFAASTGNVVYTAAAGDTVLNSFTSRGGLNLTGGSLLVNGALSAANYVQSGGLLGGAGNVTVSNSFSQSGGAINVGGNLAISQASGNLRFAALTANAISLSASTGAISQSGAVVARSLSTQSQGGTVLNEAGNRLKSFSASNSGAGGIALTTTSAPDVLVLGSLATGAGDVRIESTGGVESHAITATGGNVTLIAHSPVNVQGVVQGNDVSVDASTSVSFGDAARVNAARAIAVTAGTGITLAGAATLDVPATGSINLLAKNGDLSAADTVRINSRGATVSLLAPNGKLTVPASVLVAAPVTTPVVPPSTVSSATNTVLAINAQYSPVIQLSRPNDMSSPLVGITPSQESTTKATDESKNGIHANYCN